MTLHTFAYGGGVQSTAALVLAARGVIPHRTFLFANTGDDSEAPETLAYVREVAAPYAAQHGIELHTLNRIMRDGSVETILGRIDRTEKAEVIPVRSSAGGVPLSRSCTADFKRKVMGRWLKAHGVTEAAPAHVGLGISLDEIHRANRKAEPYEVLTYPLLPHAQRDPDCCRPTEALKLRRIDCLRIIRDAGLPIPAKSACWFCPFQKLASWAEMRETRPVRFERACQLEEQITAKAGAPRYLTRYGVPLREVVPVGVDMLPMTFEDEEWECTSAECGT